MNDYSVPDLGAKDSPLGWAWRQKVEGSKAKLVLVAMASLMPSISEGFVFTDENRCRLERMTQMPIGKIFPLVNGMHKSGILLHENFKGQAIRVKPNLASIPYPVFALLSEDRPGFVYLLRHQGRYKIGSTQNVERRLQSLRTGASHDLELVASIEVGDASGYERFLHRLYERKRLQGEWFNLKDVDVEAIKEAFTVTLAI